MIQNFQLHTNMHSTYTFTSNKQDLTKAIGMGIYKIDFTNSQLSTEFLTISETTDFLAILINNTNFYFNENPN